ncbi:hypothetical protein SO802_026515 [Lithocarpus litseifolius]|uniref:Uncharacterized protein n=1 Tax=Lithocarpus litseifolius TaxID=425828 RepID=A0AAW2C556_9ROSI
MLMLKMSWVMIPINEAEMWTMNLPLEAVVRIKTFELWCGDYKDHEVNLRKCMKGNNEGRMKELEERCSSQANLFVAVEEEKIRLSKELEKLQRELSNAEKSAIAMYYSS